MTTSRGDSVTWADLIGRSANGGLTGEGQAVARDAMGELRLLLTDSWPRRMLDKQGYLPAELTSFWSSPWMFARFLRVWLLLLSADRELSFRPVRTELRKTVERSTWLHALQQAEVAALGAMTSGTVLFEPPIRGAGGRADVLLTGATFEDFYVETTTLSLRDSARQHLEYETNLQSEVLAIENRRGVHATVRLASHLGHAGTARLLQRVDSAAALVERGVAARVSVRTGAADVQVMRTLSAAGETTFLGAPHVSDGWVRFAQLLRDKAKQTSLLEAAWIRVDAHDGLFQLTDWSTGPWEDRVHSIGVAVASVLVDAPHVHGVVISSGPQNTLSDTDAQFEGMIVRRSGGAAVRRLLAPHLFRDTVVVTLNPAGRRVAELWVTAYAGEPEWLKNQLELRGVTELGGLWRR